MTDQHTKEQNEITAMKDDLTIQLATAEMQVKIRDDIRDEFKKQKKECIGILLALTGAQFFLTIARNRNWQKREARLRKKERAYMNQLNEELKRLHDLREQRHVAERKLTQIETDLINHAKRMKELEHPTVGVDAIGWRHIFRRLKFIIRIS